MAINSDLVGTKVDHALKWDHDCMFSSSFFKLPPDVLDSIGEW